MNGPEFSQFSSKTNIPTIVIDGTPKEVVQPSYYDFVKKQTNKEVVQPSYYDFTEKTPQPSREIFPGVMDFFSYKNPKACNNHPLSDPEDVRFNNSEFENFFGFNSPSLPRHGDDIFEEPSPVKSLSCDILPKTTINEKRSFPSKEDPKGKRKKLKKSPSESSTLQDKENDESARNTPDTAREAYELKNQGDFFFNCNLCGGLSSKHKQLKVQGLKTRDGAATSEPHGGNFLAAMAKHVSCKMHERHIKQTLDNIKRCCTEGDRDMPDSMVARVGKLFIRLHRCAYRGETGYGERCTEFGYVFDKNRPLDWFCHKCYLKSCKNYSTLSGEKIHPQEAPYYFNLPLQQEKQ
jgi:hypothetical protein